ncbi:lipase maturation factor 2-like [Dendronephthya gigantea]|uniref:lipase maturation factor 2-like n=1 Tax=Dendronephthya gigantea TaxID=151771 RepID=UPI00106B5F5D|nr:lipase maturation factor 2-like [Dendronephthya gigantea]
MFVLLYWTKRLFAMKINGKDVIYTKVDFSHPQFNYALSKIVPLSIWLGAISLSFEIVRSLFRSLQQAGLSAKIYSSFQCSLVAVAAIWVFSISLVPYSNLDRTTQQNIWPVVRKWHDQVQHLEIANSYGLFRRMTGVGGRPEIVIEGSDSLDGPWKEYNFRYKPGLLTHCPPFIAPHQPRLDWQMWFAALGSYQHNPWFVHLVYKLLEGDADVLRLLAKEQPFKKPPRYVRALLYKYYYTKVNKNIGSIGDFVRNVRSIKSCWRREFTSEYLPPVTKSEPTLEQFLSHYQLGPNHKDRELSSGRLHHFIVYLRSKVLLVDPLRFLAYLFFTGIILSILTEQKYKISSAGKSKVHID